MAKVTALLWLKYMDAFIVNLLVKRHAPNTTIDSEKKEHDGKKQSAVHSEKNC